MPNTGTTRRLLGLVAITALAAACAESGEAGRTHEPAGTSSSSGPTTTPPDLDLPTAETDSDLYAAGEAATATFTNRGTKTLYLPGCAPFVFERSLDGDWVDLGPPFVCVWEGFAFPVHPGEIIDSDFTAPTESGHYRLSYLYAEDCEPDLPLSQANCQDEFVIESNPFEVERELCDPGEFGCQFVPAAPNRLCDNGENFAGPAADCSLDPVSGTCGYEFRVCP